MYLFLENEQHLTNLKDTVNTHLQYSLSVKRSAAFNIQIYYTP